MQHQTQFTESFSTKCFYLELRNQQSKEYNFKLNPVSRNEVL